MNSRHWATQTKSNSIINEREIDAAGERCPPHTRQYLVVRVRGDAHTWEKSLAAQKHGPLIHQIINTRTVQCLGYRALIALHTNDVYPLASITETLLNRIVLFIKKQRIKCASISRYYSTL